MRWNKKEKVGTTRIITKFAFLPITIKDETRWLEFVKIKQKYIYREMCEYALEQEYKWINLEFLN